jgi:sugar O-acyltransferase (sialic acid O-acetyltransferase NeuD family)
MKDLLIIGARGWGREVFLGFNKNVSGVSVKGFLDDDSHALDGLKGDFPPIISSVEDYQVMPNDVFFCAVGSPVFRKKYSEMIERKGGKFISYISPNAVINPNAVIKDGTFIGHNAFISDNVVVGKHSIVHSFCTLGHDVKIGDYVSIESYSFLGGCAEVGELSEIHVRSTILRHKKVGANASVGVSSVVIRNVKDNEHVFGYPAKRI